MRTLTIIGVFYRKNFHTVRLACSFGSEIKHMKTHTMNFQNANTNFIVENKMRILFLIVLFILSSLRMFGQTTTTSKAIQNEVEVECGFQQNQTSIVSIDSQIDFVSWFMGSGQSQMNDNESAHKSNSTVTKKQILTSGVTPNKVLYRTFMKRVISQDNAIV